MPPFDLARALRRLKPEKRAAPLVRRADADLAFVDDASLAGPPLMLDTCVYLHVLRGKTPDKVDALLRTRTLLHSAVAIAELANRLGARAPANERERDARAKLARAIAEIPEHRVVTPSVVTWGEAGILAGLHARLEHDAEKWVPVFGKTSCSDNKIKRDGDSKKSHHALAGFNKGQEQDSLNDALLLVQARAAGAIVLTENVADFDPLQQLVPDARVLFYRAMA